MRFSERYGLTETSAVTTFNLPGRRKVGSVGLPLPGYTITVRDDDGEEVVAFVSLRPDGARAEPAT
ncbi:AMP-binding protein, partial [Streptosporangium subroseum]|uniref:AMP-binding protein n=1 Tax=Streptosporangium subroseum TaxID=106412 RepID=UPI00342D4512